MLPLHHFHSDLLIVGPSAGLEPTSNRLQGGRTAVMLRRPGAASEICTRGLLHGKQVCCCYTIAAWSPLPDLRRALRGTKPPRRSLRLGGRWSPGRELNPVFAFIRRTCSHYNTGQYLTGRLRVSAFAPIALHPQRDPAFTTQAGSHTGGSGNNASHPEPSTHYLGGPDGDRTRPPALTGQCRH